MDQLRFQQLVLLGPLPIQVELVGHQGKDSCIFTTLLMSGNKFHLEGTVGMSL